jgi:hypothetical protein
VSVPPDPPGGGQPHPSCTAACGGVTIRSPSPAAAGAHRMPTFLTRPSFERLARVRAGPIDQGYPSATQACPGGAGLFLPWAGRRLAEAGGIYWIDAATEGAYGAEGEQSFEACHERAARLCDSGRAPGSWLREEGSRLRRSLVVVGSRDEASGNLVVHGCHPTAARRGHFSEAAFERTVLLARNLLPRFV